MADVDLTIQRIVRGGLAPSYSALNATDVYFAPYLDGALILHFKNTNGSICTVTFDVQQTVEGLAVVDPTLTVPATTGDRFVGGLPFIYKLTTGPDAGLVKFSQNIASGVTVAALAV